MLRRRRSPMLGADLRAARERAGLSLREVGEMAGLSAEAISAVERGYRYPSLHTLECLAWALRLKVVIYPDETVVEPEE
jgi:transcriptional regulator with XRE-family HTH domain